MQPLGLFKRKEVWVPTWRGWVLLVVAAGLILVVGVLGLVPFLGPSRPVGQGILVVEGWLPDYALAEAKQTFASHPYRLVITTGVPIDQGVFIAKETNYAQLAATTLKHLGIKSDSIVQLPCQGVIRNRTYASARRVRRWLDAQSSTEPLDIFTLGVHARRTWLLYKLALGDKYQAGIIAGKEERYDPKRWWVSSSGVRTVTSEAIAYVYAKLLFFPNNSEAREDDRLP